jgi:HD-GYP domain-containing protein (c-di-GMP phosphodiesterase class II)
VALENNRLLKKLEDLLESFVRAAGDAIEDRDPCTAGHSKRVTALTVGLAEAASAATEGPFADVHFSVQQLRELQYAGWLHDFGKIGVRESVLTKSHKLEPTHFEVVKRGLCLLREQKQTECAERKFAILRDSSQTYAPAALAQLDEELESELADDEYSKLQEGLNRLSQLNYMDANGIGQPILTVEEKDALSIRKGSLTADEFRQIQDHARLSYEFLRKIAWTPEFENIPEIAHCHHEKLNGKGYPRGVTAGQIPLQARMMTVADIYDALTASDRPYKKALPLERALHILRSEAADGSLDKDVVELFIEQKIYLRTADQEPKQGGPCEALAQ